MEILTNEEILPMDQLNKPVLNCPLYLYLSIFIAIILGFIVPSLLSLIR